MWKHSRLRFYILNAVWNYKFWLFAEKTYGFKSYDVIDEELGFENVDITGRMHFSKKKKRVKRFLGYRYGNILYLDNPGFKHTVDKDSWNAWKSKGLTKLKT